MTEETETFHRYERFSGPVGVDLAEVVRSGFREGTHRGSVVVLGPDGTLKHALGAVDTPMFPRSANKPAQALGMLRCGLELPEEADLALSAASHAGEPEHLRRVSALLARHGFAEDALGCPPDHPLSENARDELLSTGAGKRRISMNCSGKHAAMLSTCLQQGWPVHGYLDPGHPLQRTIADTVAELAGEPIVATGVDGCGAPLLAISLSGLARSFAALVGAEPGTDRRRVADAMRANPFLVAGRGQPDTELMRGVDGLLSKSAAEGVAAMAVPDRGAVALKIDDGSSRARGPVMIGALRALGTAETPAFERFAEHELLGGGERVGTVRLLPDVLG